MCLPDRSFSPQHKKETFSFFFVNIWRVFPKVVMCMFCLLFSNGHSFFFFFQNFLPFNFVTVKFELLKRRTPGTVISESRRTGCLYIVSPFVLFNCIWFSAFSFLIIVFIFKLRYDISNTLKVRYQRVMYIYLYSYTRAFVCICFICITELIPVGT